MLDPILLLSHYYAESPDLFRLLVHHSQQVRDKALSVLEIHPHLDADIQFVSEAAMLHDIGIFRCNAPDIFCLGKHKYIEHGYLGADILRNEGLEAHARVAERHTGTGITSLMIKENNLPIPPERSYIPVSIEEIVICYADKFFSKSKPDTELAVDVVRATMAKYGQLQLDRFNEWHSMFG